MASFQEETVRLLFSLQIVDSEDRPVQVSDASRQEKPRPRATSVDEMEREYQRKKTKELAEASMAGGGVQEKPQTVRRSSEKVRPNDPCFCGSGKKFKKCHGAEA